MVVKKTSFSTTIATAMSRVIQLFQVVFGLLYLDVPAELGETSQSQCTWFADKIDQIQPDLDSGICLVVFYG